MVLPKTALPINGAIEHWVDIDGSVYAYDHRNNHDHKLIKKSLQKVQGYLYCGISYLVPPRIRSKRVHRLVAEAFIPNPHHYTVVGHRNNIKSDNRVENLYWTTDSENTQKAFDDGLIKNDKGYDDSQSKPVSMFETRTNKCLGRYGSICEAVRETGLSKSTIARQAKYKRPTRREYYFRYQDDEDVSAPKVIGMFEYDTDILVRTFIHSGDASDGSGISAKTIAYQVSSGRKPKRKYHQYYFLLLENPGGEL